MKSACMAAAALLLAAGSAHAQMPAPQSLTLAASLNRGYTTVKMNLTEEAAKMPEADYGFKPGPAAELRTYGQLFAHARGDFLRRLHARLRLMRDALRATSIRGEHVVRDAMQLGHVLQFAMTVGRTAIAIQRMLGHIEFHHAATQLREFVAVGADLHAIGDKRGAGCRITTAAFDFNEAKAARTEGLEAVGRAQLGNAGAGKGGRTHHGRAFGHGNRMTVDFDGDKLLRC